MTIQHLFLRLLIFLVNWEPRKFTERWSELRLIYRSIGSCYTRVHKPCTLLVDQNPFSTPCSCGAPHLAWRSRGGYLDVPANALIGLVLVTSFFVEKTLITSVLLWEKSRKNLLIHILAVLKLRTSCLVATLLNQLGYGWVLRRPRTFYCSISHTKAHFNIAHLPQPSYYQHVWDDHFDFSNYVESLAFVIDMNTGHGLLSFRRMALAQRVRKRQLPICFQCTTLMPPETTVTNTKRKKPTNSSTYCGQRI